MKKYKLGLIGKNISHSLSPEIYTTYLNGNLEYTLLDFQERNEIPPLAEVFNNYDGLSVTAPYKQAFNHELKLVGEAKNLLAINCIRKVSNVFEGGNTDYLAIVEILKKIDLEYKIEEILILGDGVMSHVTAHALKLLKQNYQIISRKLTLDFNSLNLENLSSNKKILVINTCSRDYCYQGPVSKNTIFWDYNYKFDKHSAHFSNKCIYFDGLELLKLQAKFALEFWSIKE